MCCCVENCTVWALIRSLIQHAEYLIIHGNGGWFCTFEHFNNVSTRDWVLYLYYSDKISITLFFYIFILGIIILWSWSHLDVWKRENPWRDVIYARVEVILSKVVCTWGRSLHGWALGDYRHITSHTLQHIISLQFQLWTIHRTG